MAKKIVRNTDNLFVADLKNVKLSATQQKNIAAAIQEVVMLELANIDLGGLVIVKPPKKWELQGIVAIPVHTLPNVALKDIEAAVGERPM